MYVAFVSAFLLSLGFIGILKHYAAYLGLLDIPNERSIHKASIPRGAGIAFFLAVAFISPLFFSTLLFSYLWTSMAIVLIFLMGFWDDIGGVSPKSKFMIIIVSTLLLALDGLLIEQIGTFFTLDMVLYWFAFPFTIFVVSGFTNALNLIDGLDGLAASISLVILGAFFWIGMHHDDLFIMVVSGMFMATLLAFLCYNWHPATIFMGDSGSLLLGFVISLLGIKSLAYIPAVSILYLGALPILDTLIVMIRRKRAGRSLFMADSCHMHHLIQEIFGGSTPKTVLFLALVQLCYVLFALQLPKEMEQGYLLVAFGGQIVLLYLLFDRLIKQQKRRC